MNNKTQGRIFTAVWYGVPAVILASILYGQHQEKTAKREAQQAEWDLVTPDYSSREQALQACNNSIPRLLEGQRAYEVRRTDGLEVINILVSSENYEIQLIRTECVEKSRGVWLNTNGYFEPRAHTAVTY